MLVLLLGTALLVAPAQAKKPKVIERIPASTIAALAQAKGYEVELVTDSVGDPLVNARGTDLSHQAIFYDCAEDGCGTVQFRAWWTGKGAGSLEKVNLYNKTTRQGRAYLDQDGDPTFELLVELQGGVTEAFVSAQYDQFIEVSDIFMRLVLQGK